jgi:GNAT superfamily N-acetyltransferase
MTTSAGPSPPPSRGWPWPRRALATAWRWSASCWPSGATPGAAEITYAAVLRERQGAGVGTALVDEAIAALAADGVALVEVKTLDASAGYHPYEATRAFWEARGFRQIDRIDPLPGWQPGNPAAIYVAALGPTR